jgi:hypothetical protein
MTDYRIRLKSGTNPDWKNCSTAIIAVSLGNEGTRGDKLKAIIDWINAQPNFTRCIIDLSDTLYAWNVTGQVKSVTEADRAIGRKMGDEWLAENGENLLLGLRMPPELMRWDYWLKHPEFNGLKTEFRLFELREPKLRGAIDLDIARFVARKAAQGVLLTDTEIKNTREFIFEELPAHTLMHREFPDAAKIYPGATSENNKLMMNGLPGAPPGLETQRRVEIRIERAPHFADEMRALPRTDRQPV